MSSNGDNEIYFKVAKVISEQLKVDETNISHDTSFDNLNADSLDQIQILMRVEELFNIEISDQAASTVICVKDLVTCVNQSLKN